jgi:glutaredoxin
LVLIDIRAFVGLGVIDTLMVTYYNDRSMIVEIVLYGKPGCHLCEDAKNSVLTALDRYEFSFEEVNILDDDDLFNKYVEDIPVITINGNFYCQYKVHLQNLEDKLNTLIERRKP